MSQPPLFDFPLRANEPTFMGIPPELRLIIYEQFILDLISRRSFRSPSRRSLRSPIIAVGFCCETDEVTPHNSTFRQVFTILHLCQKFRYEAEPLVYARVSFIMGIRPHSNPLDFFGHFFGDVGYRLSQARKIQLHISNGTTCGLEPYRPEHDPRSVARERRRVSWDGGSSFDWEISRAQARSAL